MESYADDRPVRLIARTFFEPGAIRCPALRGCHDRHTWPIPPLPMAETTL